MTTIASLPIDILFKTLPPFLTPKELHQLARTSKDFKALYTPIFLHLKTLITDKPRSFQKVYRNIPLYQILNKTIPTKIFEITHPSDMYRRIPIAIPTLPTQDPFETLREALEEEIPTIELSPCGKPSHYVLTDNRIKDPTTPSEETYQKTNLPPMPRLLQGESAQEPMELEEV